MTSDPASFHIELSPRFIAGAGQGAVKSYRDASWGGLKQGVVKVDSTNRTNLLAKIPFLDLASLNLALEMLAKRYTVLMCRIEERDSSPWLVPTGAPAPKAEVIDYRDSDSVNREEVESAIGKVVWLPIDFTSGPLFRAYAVLHGPRDRYVGLVVHHFISDAVSIDILIRDLSRLYEACARGTHPDLLPIQLSYEDYLRSINTWIQSEGGQTVLQLAVDRLGTLPELDFGSLLDPADGEEQPVQFSAITVERVRAAAKTLNTTVFTILLAGQYALLVPFASNPNVTLKVITTGRETPSLMRVAGDLADRLYVPANMSGDPDFAEIVARAHQALGTSRRYAFVRDDFVQKGLGQREAPAAAPVFNFRTIQKRVARSEGGGAPHMPVLRVPDPGGIIKTRPKDDYYLVLLDNGDSIQGYMRFGKGRIRGFPEALDQVLGDCCADPQVTLAEIVKQKYLKF